MSLTSESIKIIKELNISRVPTFPPGQDLQSCQDILYRDISAGYKKARQLETFGQHKQRRDPTFGAGDLLHVRKEMLQKMGARVRSSVRTAIDG